MSYHINYVESEDFCVEAKDQAGKKKVMGFMANGVGGYLKTKIDEGNRDWLDPATVRRCEEAIDVLSELSLKDPVADEDVKKAVMVAQDILADLSCQFTVYYDGWSFWIDYFDSCLDWDGDDAYEFLKGFAPYAVPGAYVGFIGEDGDMWSYVFDGAGGIQKCTPSVDWRHGYIPKNE